MTHDLILEYHIGKDVLVVIPEIYFSKSRKDRIHWLDQTGIFNKEYSSFLKRKNYPETEIRKMNRQHLLEHIENFISKDVIQKSNLFNNFFGR